MNVISIVGNIGSDPELRTAASGTSIASFRVAVRNSRKRNNEDGSSSADWFTVKAFGQQAEFVVNYLTKGRKVAITGRMEVDRTESATYHTIIASDVEAVDAPKDNPPQANMPAPAAPAPKAKPASKPAPVQVEEDYDPFAE